MRNWLLIFLISVSPFWASGSNKIITDAQIFEKDNKTKIITLEGDVNVVFQDQHLLCDKAKVYEKTKTIIAEGNVILKTPKSTLTGERMEFNYETNKGKVFNAIVTSNNVLIESEVIEKIGEEEYLGKNAYYTNCITCPPSWGFTSKKLRAKMGDFAYIHRPWLYILDFPVLPLPYLAVPLNTKRQTGFLFPKQAISTGGGFGFEQPYFWAIDRSSDATFSGIYYDKRGLQGLANYRYMLTEESFGEMSTGFIHDRSDVDNFPSGRNRWFLEYDHFYDLPENYVQRIQMRLVGDRFYPQDFPTQSPHFGEGTLDNRVSITKNFEDAHLSADSSYYVSLVENEVRPDNQESLHRFPEINFITSEMQLFQNSPLTFQFESQYLNIGRQGLAYDHLQRGTELCPDPDPGDDLDEACVANPLSSGSFQYYDPNTQTGDLVRTGQRLDNLATFSAPFWLGQTLDVNPEVRLRYTQYALGVQSDPDQGYDSVPSRTYLQMNLGVRSYLSRVFDSKKSDIKYKHSIVPSVEYQYIPLFQQSSSRFFGTKENIPVYRANRPLDDGDIDIDNGGRGIQFDFRDRIIGRHLVRLGLLNKVFRKEGDVGVGEYSRAFLLDISQAYDFTEADQPNGRPWQEIEGRLAAQYGKLVLHNNSIFYPYHAVTDVISSLQFNFASNSFVSLGYSLTNDIPEDPADRNNLFRSDSLTFGSGIRSRWIDISGFLEYSPRGDIVNDTTNETRGAFRRWRALFTLKPPGECWIVKGDFSQTLDTDQFNSSISMEFQFGKE